MGRGDGIRWSEISTDRENGEGDAATGDAAGDGEVAGDGRGEYEWRERWWSGVSRRHADV